MPTGMQHFAKALVLYKRYNEIQIAGGKKKTDVAAVIPTLDEAENIGILLQKLQWFIPGITFYVIDDNSVDGTAEIARKRGAILPSLGKRLGLGKSYLLGLNMALNEGHKYIALLDADHPADVLPRMIEQINNSDVVVGQELCTRSPASKVAGWIARRLLGLDLAQPSCGYILFKRWVLEGADLHSVKSHSDAVHLEILYRAKLIGAKIVELPFKGISHERASFKRIVIWLYDVLRISLERF